MSIMFKKLYIMTFKGIFMVRLENCFIYFLPFFDINQSKSMIKFMNTFLKSDEF